MITLDLCGKWKMKRDGEETWLDAMVPGSVMMDLLNAGKIQDPFFRDNEDEASVIASYDHVYTRDFQVDPCFLMQDQIFLHCKGLDTLAEIRINGAFLTKTENMHRTYLLDAKPLLREGRNAIEIRFFSPVKYVKEKHRENPIWESDEHMEGFSHLRKAHYMFGWDWGPIIPDMGIWRGISLEGYSTARLRDVYITQKHEAYKVLLDVRVQSELWSGEPVNLAVTLTTPEGSKITSEIAAARAEEHILLDIENPSLWWPRGYGNQPLYHVEVEIKSGQGVQESKHFDLGLRTMEIRREKDPWGTSFAFAVNGTAVFAMGANYIPEDNLLARCNPHRTEQLIRDCVEANFNCIRVWGGGIYPEDYFFDLCDRYGLIVWHDLMFACATYDVTDAFAENITREAEDNIRRIRHHACLGLWCGNNEMETAFAEWNFKKTPKLQSDYIKQFEILLPKVAAETDPNTFYWLSSPSSGGGFDHPNDENRGDVHYWEVWHGQKEFGEYRKHYFRFVSEFGFQSFPGLKTVESFTLPEDRNIFSYIMERHQKNHAANGRILYHLSSMFKYPKDFDSLLYISQLLQAEAMKCGVEHWRRNRGRCMGTIYWQLNDCWPVASWASRDSLGRWKALHYYAKRFYSPLLVSANEEGTRVELHVTNETSQTVRGKVFWKLRDAVSEVLAEGRLEAEIGPLSTRLCETLDFSELLAEGARRRRTYLEFAWMVDGREVSSGTVLFVKPKHFEFSDPRIQSRAFEEDGRVKIELRGEAFAKQVELELQHTDGVFSDNYFDLSPGETKVVEIRNEGLTNMLTAEEVQKQLQVRCIYHTA